MSLFRERDAWFVFRVDDGTAEKRRVQIGETNGLETEIEIGLSAGDQVVLHPTDKIRDGVKVKTDK